MSSYDKYTSSSVSTSNVRTVSPMRVNTSLYKEPETDYCRRCAKYIYPLEMMGPVMGFKYHKLCFRCHICERQLDFKNYRTNVIDLNDRELYCSAHNPRNGAFNENVYGYNARSGSASGPNDMQVNEYSSEYYKTQQHKSNENLDSVGRSRSPYGGYVGNLSRMDYAAAHGGAPVGYVGAEPSLTIPSANPVGWKSEKYSKSTEQLNHASSSSSMTMMQSHHRHEYSSSSSSTTGGHVTTLPASPAAAYIGVPITNPSGTYYVNTPTSPTTINSNVHILPTTLNNDRYTYEQYDNHNASSNNTGGIRNIVVDVISHRDESDSDDHHNINNDRRAPYYNNQNYSSSDRQYDTAAAIPSAGASYGGSSLASSGGASSFHQYSSSSSNVDNYNLRAIISEAMLHDKQHRPTSLYYSTTSQQPQQVPAVQPEYYRQASSSSSSSNSNLKKIYAEASMTAAIRSPSTPKQSVDFPSPIRDLPPPSTPTANLKNIYSEALNQHNQQQQQQQQQHRVVSSSNVNYFEGKDSNLKRIFAEASESAAHPAPPHHQRVVMSSTDLSSSTSDNRLNNIKHIVNEAAITNSLADKIAASTQVYAGPSHYSTSYVPPQQPQTTVIPGQVISEHRQEYSSSSSSSAVKQVISGGETVQHHHQQQHSQFYEASSSSTSSLGGGSPMISRPPINNQITLPTDSGIDRKSNLVNIMSDVIATNNSAYTAYPNRFQFTGPNANLKGIVAEAADYNARIAPSNQNMYHNLRDAPLSAGDINPNSIIGDQKGFGIVRLTVHYDQLRSRLSVTVHEARNLKNLDKKSISDPYARVYLKPDGKPSYKRKTRIVKNNLSPVWQETFDYSMTLNEALEKVLTVNLKDERGFFEKQEGQFLGEVVIPLASVRNLTQPFTKWFFLQPLNSNSILANVNTTAGGHVSSF